MQIPIKAYAIFNEDGTAVEITLQQSAEVKRAKIKTLTWVDEGTISKNHWKKCLVKNKRSKD